MNEWIKTSWDNALKQAIIIFFHDFSNSSSIITLPFKATDVLYLQRH